MPHQPELLKSTCLVPVVLAPEGFCEIISTIEKYVRGGEIEEAIGLASWYCFDPHFSFGSLTRRRYVLKRLWFFLDELFSKRLDSMEMDQVRFPGGFMEADSEAYRSIEKELLNDMRRSRRLARLLGTCESGVLLMLENENYFTAEGFRLLAERLTQFEDGA